MGAEGMDFYKTPIQTWLSHCLLKVQNNGGKPILLSTHVQNQEQTTNDLINRLEQLNIGSQWGEEWKNK